MSEKKNKSVGTGPVEPVQLTGRSRLCFACHRGLKCFTTCCCGMEILLAPFDILRLKKKLGLTSGEFLSRHTVVSTHHESELPVVILKMGEDENRTCSFLTADGCSVYDARPSICRYYPVGLAALRTKNDQNQVGEDRFYFLVKEEHCLGHGEDREWTVDAWREDQGASQDDEHNRDWQSAFLSRTLPGGAKIDERRQSLFYMACYDLDAFRHFALESPFLERFDVDPETVEKIRGSDEELLRFALRYMKFFMMIEETFKPREGVLKSWQEKNREQ